MAVAFVQKLSSATLSGGGSSAQSVAFTSNPTVGNSIIVEISAFTPSTISTFTVTDTAGNTYTVDAFVERLSDVGNYQHAAIARTTVTSTGASFKVTVSSGVTSSDFFFQATEFSGVGALDKTATASNGHTTTSLTVGPTAALASTGELLIGAFGVESSTTNAGISTPATFSGPTLSTASTSIAVNQDGSTVDGGEFSYAIASATTAPSVKWTYTNDTNTWPQYVGVLATYQASSSGVSENLTGQTATFTEGTVSRSVTYALTGQTATFSEGSLSLNIVYSLNDGVPLTGQTATFSEGTPTETLSYTLTGQTGTFTEGTPTGSVSYTLGSQTATFTEGSITATQGGNVSKTLTGQSATFTEGTLSSAIASALSGQSITSSEGSLTHAVAYGLLATQATFTEGTLTVSKTGNVSIQLSAQVASFSLGVITVRSNQLPSVVLECYDVQIGTALLRWSRSLNAVAYRIYINGEPQETTVAGQFATVSGLLIDTPYTFNIAAINSDGIDASILSNTVGYAHSSNEIGEVFQYPWGDTPEQGYVIKG